MAELPLLLFPKAKALLPPKGKSKFPRYQKPSAISQRERLDPQFRRLNESFGQIQAGTDGASPEQVIVIEVYGRIDRFESAVRALGLEWLDELELGELESEFGFHNKRDEPAQESMVGGLFDAPVQARMTGQLFLVMSDQRAMDELLSLWKRWTDPAQPFPRGQSKWKTLFENLRSIERWNERHRLQDTGILEYFEEELQFEEERNTLIPCEIELWFRDNPKQTETRIRALIEDMGGEQIGVPCHIPEIRFHALKCQLPPDAIRTVTKQCRSGNSVSADYPSLFREAGIHRFRPAGQSAISLQVDESNFAKIEPFKVTGSPVVALLDGLPLTSHQLLGDAIILDDPDDFTSDYQAGEQRHGTSMASLILHGDLQASDKPLNRPIYARPILKPDPGARGFGAVPERIPPDLFPEDLIWRAVRRMKDHDGDVPAQAPDVVLINLSVADNRRQFIRELSPWAKLLDWLAFEYRVLFLISAGNKSDAIDLGLHEDEFKSKTDMEKSRLTSRALHDTQRHRRLSPPAESVNNLTIGALHDDATGDYRPNRRLNIQPLRSLPSPISAQGPGYRRSIKPDILMPGGRQLYDFRYGSTEYRISRSLQPPGQQVAATATSTNPGDTHNTIFTRGTSNATALATRGGAQLLAMLDELLTRHNAPHGINRSNRAALLKALLVHGAAWGEAADYLRTFLRSPENSRRFKRVLAQHIGYGVADVQRVLHCVETRATAIAADNLRADQVHEYRFPLPVSLRSSEIKRRLTITVGWLTPVNPAHRSFRRARLEFTSPNGSEDLAVKRSSYDHHQVKRGTLQHEIFEGDRAVNFEDGGDIVVRIHCKADAGVLEQDVPYGLAVTLEVAEESRLPIYEEVALRIRQGLAVRVAS